MGLATNHASPHYRQRDGYGHAADLRTAGRGEARNRLVQLYFWIMGFGTLRHVGTADQPHVQLPGRAFAAAPYVPPLPLTREVIPGSGERARDAHWEAPR